MPISSIIFLNAWNPSSDVIQTQSHSKLSRSEQTEPILRFLDNDKKSVSYFTFCHS